MRRTGSVLITLPFAGFVSYTTIAPTSAIHNDLPSKVKSCGDTTGVAYRKIATPVAGFIW